MNELGGIKALTARRLTEELAVIAGLTELRSRRVRLVWADAKVAQGIGIVAEASGQAKELFCKVLNLWRLKAGQRLTCGAK